MHFLQDKQDRGRIGQDTSKFYARILSYPASILFILLNEDTANINSAILSALFSAPLR